MLKITRFLRLAAFTACLGLGLRALFYDLPLRAIVWDEAWWRWCARLLGFTWREWVTSPAVDSGIETTKLAIAATMIFIAILIALVKPRTELVRVALWVAFFILLSQHLLVWKEHFWQIGQLLELTLLTTAPLLYARWTAVSALPATGNFPFSGRVMAGLIALTFVGHGLYAVGFHPLPANFVLMTQASLGIGEQAARQLLFVVGMLDFVAAALLFLPWPRAWRIALGWVIPWAIFTTLARWWSYQGIVEWYTLLTQWLPELIIRLPHVLVPLALWSWVNMGANAGASTAPMSNDPAPRLKT